MKGAENTNNNLSFIVCIFYFFFPFSFPLLGKRISNVIEMINLDGKRKKKYAINQQICSCICMEVPKEFPVYFWVEILFLYFVLSLVEETFIYGFSYLHIQSKGFLVDMLLILQSQTFDSGLIVE